MSSARLARVLLRTGIGLGISFAAVLLIAKTFDLTRTGQILQNAGLPALGIAGLLLAADVLARGRRWEALLRPVMPNPRASVLPHLLVGYLVNNALPARIGEIVRCHTLGEREGMSRATVGGTVVVERLLDVAVLAVIALAALFLTPSSGALQVGVATAVVLSLGGAALVWRIVTGRPGDRVSRFMDRPGLRVVSSLANRVHDGLAVVRSRRSVVAAVAWSAVAWTVTGVAFAVTARFVGLELTPPQVILFVAGVNLVAAVPAGPSNLGTFELAAVSVAAALGVSATQALAMAVIVHVATVAVTTTGGMLSLAYLYLAPAPRRVPAMADVSADPRDR